MSPDLLHQLTLGDVLAEVAAGHPGRLAAVDGEVRLTYAEVDARVNRLANALGAAGVGRGDLVLWLGQNSHRLVETLFACARTGAVFCPLNWRQSATEIGFCLRDCEPAVVIHQEAEVGERVAQARAGYAGAAIWLRHDTGTGTGADGYEAFLAGADAGEPDIAVDAAWPVLQMYTAAFDGTPNGAQLPHLALIVQDLVMAKVQDVDHTTVCLNCGPLFHVAALMTTLATLHFGGTNVYTPRVDAEELCRLVDAEGCTHAFLMPPTMDQMVAANADGRYDLRSLRSIPYTPEWNAMVTVDTSPWAQRPGGYGQTELMGLASATALGGEAIGAHGRASPAVRIRIVGPDGAEMARGETGEIVARGLVAMCGYHDRAALDAARQHDGWHHTGDLGRREADGSLTFVGPISRVIKSAAENVYPAEVEACLRSHPAVADCCVIGVPDPTWRQRVKAVVVLRDGAAATGDELIAHCRTAMASYKKPREVVFVDDLPRTRTGLVDRDRVDEAHGGGGYPGMTGTAV